MELKPKIIDFFRVHDGKVSNDVENSRKFGPDLWRRMWNGENFTFDWKRGMRDIPDGDPYDFPMAEYLLAQDRGMCLKKILGSDVKIVTQKKLLKDLMFMLIYPKSDSVHNPFYFERFGDVLLVKLDQPIICYEQTTWDRYLEKRREFFNGDDHRGCIGSTHEEDFEFPDVGKAYTVQTLKHGKSRIMYSCIIKNFAPDGEPIDSILSRNNFTPSYSKERAMLLNAATDGYKYHMFFKIKDGDAQMEFRDTEAGLRDNPVYQNALSTVLDLLLDKRISKYLANRRGCAATLEFEPELRLKPFDFPPDYKSFLTDDFFLRFFDDED